LGIPGIKYALNKMGVQVGEARLPFLPLKKDEKEDVDKLLDYIKKL